MFRAPLAIVLVLSLSGCSYSYDVRARISDGRLIFDANPQWGADCVRHVEVSAEAGRSVTVWEQSISYDDVCENKFPIAYGVSLRGRPHAYEGDVPDALVGTFAPSVPAKTLRAGVVYKVSTTTGATGYGCGRFRLGPNGQVENLVCR